MPKKRRGPGRKKKIQNIEINNQNGNEDKVENNNILATNIRTEPIVFSDDIYENEDFSDVTILSSSTLQNVDESTNTIYLKDEFIESAGCGKDLEEITPVSEKPDNHLENTYVETEVETNDPLCNESAIVIEIYPETDTIFFQEEPIQNVSEIQIEENIDLTNKSKAKSNLGLPLESSFECEICSRKFKRSVDLQSHKLIHNKMFVSGEVVYQCDECEQQFKKINELKTHKVIHKIGKPYKCAECDKSFSRSNNLLRHTQTHKNKTCQCLICGEVFNGKNELVLHVKIHTNEQSNVCQTCGKYFKDIEQLKIHEIIHGKVKSFECDDCGLQFRAYSNLSRHKRKHAERNFPCEICGKKFLRKFDVERHKVIHSGVKPYKCSDCGKDFARFSDLVRHGKIHTGERPHKCDICGKSFIELNKLKLHQNIHVEKKIGGCNTCGKSFNEFHLKRHQRNFENHEIIIYDNAVVTGVVNETVEAVDSDLVNINQDINMIEEFDYEGMKQSYAIVTEEGEILIQNTPSSSTHNFGDLAELHALFNNADVSNANDFVNLQEEVDLTHDLVG